MGNHSMSPDEKKNLELPPEVIENEATREEDVEPIKEEASDDWTNKAIRDWDSDDISHWLRSIGFFKLLKKHSITSQDMKGKDLTDITIAVEDFNPHIKDLYRLFLFFCNLHIIQYCLIQNQDYPKNFFAVNVKLFHKRILNQKILEADKLNDWKIQTFSKMCLWLSEAKYIQERFLDPREVTGELLEVKLVITENMFTTTKRTIRKVISPILNIILPQEFGLFHLALMVGPWYLDWNDSSCVLPRSHTSGAALLTIDIGTISTKDEEERTKVKQILCKSIARWNSEYQYANYPNKKKKMGNCHTFTMDVLERLQITIHLEEGGVLKNFLSEMSFWGTCNLTFRPSEKFVEDFKLLDNAEYRERFYHEKKKQFRIHFESHRYLDEFVYYCSDANEKKQRKYDQEFTLLKSFDRAFWLRHSKDPQNDDYKPHPFTEERIFGCPYSDLRDTAFWNHFFKEHKSNEGVEEVEGEHGEKILEEKKIEEKVAEIEMVGIGEIGKIEEQKKKGEEGNVVEGLIFNLEDEKELISEDKKDEDNKVENSEPRDGLIPDWK